MAYTPTSLLTRRPNLKGKAILVTGGTGSFGQAFVKRLLDEYEPRKVVVFSRDEQKHYVMRQRFPDSRLRSFVGDIRDAQRLMRALDGIDIVVHAAAMKHVPIAEYNPIEAIRTNIDGAANLIEAALERQVELVVGLSTDKAASPVNLYGATKLAMEKLLVAANAYSGVRPTRFKLVRYGNVVGSAGSVVPLFMRQREEGKLTLTDPSMTRFWITMEHAVDLVLLAMVEGGGGEVFVPKIPACSVEVLAEAVAPGVPREVIGVRPGEKFHEVLITRDEARSVAEYDRYYVLKPSFRTWPLSQEMAEGEPVDPDFHFSSDVADQLNAEDTRALLRSIGYAV